MCVLIFFLNFVPWVHLRWRYFDIQQLSLNPLASSHTCLCGDFIPLTDGHSLCPLLVIAISWTDGWTSSTTFRWSGGTWIKLCLLDQSMRGASDSGSCLSYSKKGFFSQRSHSFSVPVSRKSTPRAPDAGPKKGPVISLAVLGFPIWDWYWLWI